MKLLTLLLLHLPAAALAATITEATGKSIGNEWIAVLKTDAESDGVSISSMGVQSTIQSILSAASSDNVAANATGSVDIEGLFKAVTISAPRHLLDSIADMPEIAYIEPNYAVTLDAVKTQKNAPWGLARLSRRAAGAVDYRYNELAGQNTWAYVLDTGIDVTHPQFGGRATWGTSFIPNQVKDGHGHGTHVAGTIGSNTYGVAKKTKLIAVKVLNNAGSASNAVVIQGMQWAVSDARKNGRVKRSVVNMSLGGPSSQAMKDAAKAVTDAGLFLAVAAGNDGMPVSTTSPANAPSACTVGASDSYDWMAWFSNYGDLVDVFAPGVGIKSTYLNHGTYTMDGTSMATPHVAGLAAYFISTQGPKGPVAMCQYIQKMATKDAVFYSYSKNDMLAFNGVPAA